MKINGLRAVSLFGIVYFAVGIVFADVANSSATNEIRTVWRLGAWLASAVAFAAHIGYGHFRLRNSIRSTSLQASLAPALGAFALAAAANIRAITTASGNRTFLAIALVIWPVMTALPA